MNVVGLLSLYLHVTQSLKLADLIKKIYKHFDHLQGTKWYTFYITPVLIALLRKLQCKRLYLFTGVLAMSDIPKLDNST